jgi:hypothetical protein
LFPINIDVQLAMHNLHHVLTSVEDHDGVAHSIQITGDDLAENEVLLNGGVNFMVGDIEEATSTVSTFSGCS